MSALTRIFNNQIYNATIIGYQKIAPGSITGSLFASNVTVPGDLLISGNLFVLGTSAYTTIASTNTYVNDPLVTLNNGFSGTNNRDIGLVLNRGTDQNQAIVWAEPFKEFRLIGTTETGTTYGNVVVSNFANLHVGNIGVDYTIRAGSLNVNTAITSSSLNLSGNLLASTVLASFVTASTSTFGNVAAVTVGNVGTQFNGAAINLSGNVLASSVLTNFLTADDVVFGNVSASVFGNVGAIFTGASINLSGNVLALNILSNFVTADDAVFGNISAALIGNTGATVTGTTAAFTGNVIGGLAQFAAINSTPIGNATASTGAFTTLTASGIVEFTNTTPTTGLGTGALRVSGGTSITGNLFVGGNLNVIGNSFVVTSNAGVFYGDANGFGALYAGVAGYTPLPATVVQTAGNFNGYVQNNFENLSTGAKASTDWVATAGDGSDVNHYIDMGITTANWDGTQDNSLTNAVGANDGYLYVQGNITSGQGGNLTIGSSNSGTRQVKVIVGGNTASFIVARFNNPGTPALSSSTGVFTVTGGVGIAGNIYAGAGIQNTVIGNVTPAAGSFTTLNASGYFNATGNISTPQLNAGQINTTGNVLATTGVFNALTVNGNESVTGYLNVTGNVMADAGTVRILNVNNTLWANSSTATTTQGTGALIIPTGGISVTGNANIAGSITTAGAAQFNNTVTVGGITSLTNTNNSTEATGSSGALQIKGGTSIAKDLWVGGNIYASNIFGVTHQVITVQDPLVYFDAANTFPYNYDIGFYSNFVGPNPIDNTGNAYQHSGMVRDNADNTWKFFSNVRTEPAGTSIAFNSDTIYYPVLAGNLRLTYTQAATSTTTGALQVAGGAGIAGTVVAAQLNSTGNVLGQTGTFSALTVNGGITSTGYFNTSGNISTAQLNAGQINTTGNVLASTVLSQLVTADDATFGNVASGFIGNVGTQFTGASLNLSGNVLAASGIYNYLDVNGNVDLGQAGAVSGSWITVTGNITQVSAGGPVYINTTGNISTAQLNAGQINTTGNVLATAGVFNALTVNGSQSVSANLNVGGNILATNMLTNFVTADDAVIGNISAAVFGNTGATFIGSSINLSANVLAAAGTFNALTVNGNESITGFLNVTGNVLASTVRASFLTASTAAVGNISAVTIGNSGATITGTTGAFSGNVIGGLAQFAAINNTPIGNATASTGSFTVLSASQTIYANSPVQTSTTTTGAIIVPNGGVSVSGNIYAGEHLYVGPSTPSIAATNGFFPIGAAKGDPVYIQMALQNLNGQGSADFAAYSSDATPTSGWADMGFTGNAFADPNYTITKPHDGYFIVRPNATYGGNLVLATSEAGVYNDIVFAVGSFQSTAEVARFDGNVGTNGNLRIKYATTSTSTTSGALQVVGGVGVGGNLRVGGGAVINSGQTADPFQVRGVATTSLIYADTAQGAVIVGGSNTAPQLGSTLKVNGTDSLLLPIGSTGQRPGATGNIDVAGMIRFNTTIQNMEFYDGTQWQTAGSVFTVISDRQFTGNTAGGFGNVDGTNTNFTIQANATTSSTIVSINGVIQFPTLAYSVSGTTLTFTEPPAPDDVIDVRVLTTTSTVSALANGNGLQQFIASDDALEFWSGVSATTKQAQINKVGDFEFLTGGKTTYTQTATNIAANNTPYVIATYSQTAYTTAKFLISAKRGTTNFQSMETMITADGQGNAFVTTYAVVSNGVEMGGVTANVVGGNVRLYWTTTTNITNANVKAMGTFIV